MNLGCRFPLGVRSRSEKVKRRGQEQSEGRREEIAFAATKRLPVGFNASPQRLHTALQVNARESASNQQRPEPSEVIA